MKQRLYNDVNFIKSSIDWSISMHCILFKNSYKKLCINDASKLNKFVYKTSPSPKSYVKAIVKELCCNIILWTLKKILFKSI